MKIKIAYTIDKEEVKDKVSEIIESVIKPLQTQFNLLVSVSSSLKEQSMSTAATVQLLDSVRHQLALIDQTLEEVHQMLKQFDQLEQNLKQKPETSEQKLPQHTHPTTADWQKQLASDPSNQMPLSSQEMKQYLDLMNESLNLQKGTLEKNKGKI